ncbi:MAG: hypothetical protein ACRDPS_09675 [Nocardioides sp.]
MKKRVRVEVPFEIEVVDGFDAVKKRKRDRAHGERTAFLGRVDYCDEAA